MYPRRYGSYVLLEKLGAGGMSEVDLARKGTEGMDFVRFVALKRIKTDRLEDNSFVRMFKDEARITSELHHANIAQVYDFGRIEDEYFLALEYVPGLDVRQVINVLRDRNRRIPMKVLLRIVVDVLEGLAYAHEKVDTLGRPMNIIHRDVNPRNIMISVRGDVKLIDFGVARATHRLERTETDHVKGKFAYMAPEQIRGEGELDHRVDLFSVGLTLHELLVGYSPFHGLTQVQIMHRLLQGQIAELRVPRDYPEPERMLEIHRRALARDPEDRFGSAREFAEALRQAAVPVGGLASRDEMVAFVSRVQPTIQKEVRDKLHNYSGPVDLGPVKEQLAASDLEASMSGVMATREVDTKVNSVLLAGGFATVVALLFTVGALVLAVIFVLSNQQSVSGAAEGDAALLSPTGLPVEAQAPREPVDAGEPDVHGAAPVEPQPSSPGATSRPQPTRPVPMPPVKTPEPAALAAPAPEPAAEEAGSDSVEPPVSAPDEGASGEPARGGDALVETTDPASEPEPAGYQSPAKQGLIQVNSSPQGLTIFVDGKDTGKATPERLRLAVGRHTVVVEGHSEQEVHVLEGQSVNVVFRESSP